MKTSIKMAIATIGLVTVLNSITVQATPTNKYLKYYDDRHTEYVTADIGLNVRRQPNTDSQIITVLSYGDEVEVLAVTEEDEEWTAVYVDKSVWYVYNKYISKDKPEQQQVEDDNDTEEDYAVQSSGSNDDSGDYVDYLGTLRLTAYEHDGTLCANGNYPSEWWTCASNELPFGTIVEISGLGRWIVEDTGAFGYGALDLFLGDPDVCEEFGVQYADVWVVRYGY